MGAFDPLTNAHLAVLGGASRSLDCPGALCMTKVLLSRSDDPLLSIEDRIDVLTKVAERCELSLVFANRGTYLDVGRAIRSEGIDATFVVGADKIAQLGDSSFYDDGEQGVEATFAETRFIVVPREGSEIARQGLQILDATDVFASPEVASISATDVRRLVRLGRPVDDLVPREVGLALEGYTSAR